MNGEDDNIWATYGRGVKKLKEDKNAMTRAEAAKQTPFLSAPDMPDAWRKAIGEETKERKPEEKKLSVLPAQESPAAPASPCPAPAFQPLDLRIERNLSLGDVVIEARLDLHGKTESEAHEKLLDFVEEQHRRKRRLVLVITGKGREGAAPLRVNVPRWCGVSPLAEKVLAVRAAAPHHGGDGAYYVLLKK